MGEILMGLLIGSIGLLLLFTGYRFARFLLPIWGFISGFMLGASLISDSTTSSFLGTVFGIMVGFGLGLLFAILIYAYYYVAVVLLGAATGYWLGASFIGLFGIDPGFLTTITGIALGVVFALASIALNFPKIFLIAMTSIGGAVVIIAALMLIFDVIPNEYLSYNTVTATINNSMFWWISTFVLAFIGVGTQSSLEKELEVQQWNMFNEMQAKKPAAKSKKAE